MFKTKSSKFSAAAMALAVGASFMGSPDSASALTLNTFATPSGAPIGFAYAGNKFVGSIQKDGTGVLYSTDLTGGSIAPFSSANLIGSTSSEHFVASSVGLGGFANRDIYVAAGNTVVHITNDGSSNNNFVTGLASDVRGILFDTVGTFGNDMLITTNGGQIYRVNSAGTSTLLKSIGEDTEGLDVAPLGAGFGAFDGQLIIASEGSGHLRALSNTGVLTDLASLGAIVGSAEELTFVPLNLGASGNPVEGFYGASYPTNVQKANASEFLGMQGDVIVTGETTHQVSRVHWDGTKFVVTNIGTFPAQPEDGIFVTAAIITGGGPTVPEPASIVLFGSGLLGIVVWAKGRRQKHQV